VERGSFSEVVGRSAGGAPPDTKVRGAIRVLLIDDGARAVSGAGAFLETQGLIVSSEKDGQAGIRAIQRAVYDIVLLTSTLSGIGGLEVCRRVRACSNVPIVMMTSEGGESDGVPGLEAGADDFFRQTLPPRELLARIRAHVRRARGLSGPTATSLVVGALSVDTGAFRATLEGKMLSLTDSEFALLRVLAERTGKVLSREQLLDLASGSSENAFERSIDVHISRLRRKIETNPHRPRRLRTIRGRGYTLVNGDADRGAA
jgi:two-component system, OmpR family, response regulator